MRTILARAGPIVILGANLALGALIQVGTVDESGTGFGTVDTVLTIQNTGTEVGCVGRLSGGSSDVAGADDCGTLGFAGGDERLNGSGGKTATLLIDPTILDLEALRVIFNVVESQSDDGSVTLNNLQLSIYDPAGTKVFTSGAFEDPVDLSGFNGQGQSGVAFALDPGDAALASQFYVEGNRIGLNASVSGASGGADSFRIAEQLPGPEDPGEVPEPATILTLGLGLVALGLKRRTE